MLLDELVTAIQTVQARIREHGSSLNQNEYRTRISLIDPILNALGWDVSDPGLVIHEYAVGNGRADYALLRQDGSPTAFVEAKRLGEMADASRHETQLFTYAVTQGVKYAGLTDGDRWLFDNLTARFSGGVSRLLDVTLSRESAHQCALKLLLLWRPTLAAGQPIEANRPILVESTDSELTKDRTESPQPPPQGALPSTPPSLGWIPLSEYRPGKHDPLPLIRLPGENEIQLQKWYGLLVEVAEWLIRRGSLTEDSCPVPGAVRGYSMINAVPKHENGEDLFHPERLSNGLYLNKQGNRDTLLSNAKSLLKHFGEDPASILLKPS